MPAAEPRIKIPVITNTSLAFLISILWFLGKAFDLAVSWADGRAEAATTKVEHNALYQAVMAPEGLKAKFSGLDKQVSGVASEVKGEWTARTEADVAMQKQIAELKIVVEALRHTGPTSTTTTVTVPQ